MRAHLAGIAGLVAVAGATAAMTGWPGLAVVLGLAGFVLACLASRR